MILGKTLKMTCFDLKASRRGSFKVPIAGLSTTQWLQSFQLPQFSTKTMDSIKAKSITKGVRVEIVTALAFEIWNHTQYPSADEYNAVCTMLVKEYPILKDTIGNGYVSLCMFSFLNLECTILCQYRALGNYRYDKN